MREDDDIRVDNVICRTPARNAQNLELVKSEILEMVDRVVRWLRVYPLMLWVMNWPKLTRTTCFRTRNSPRRLSASTASTTASF